MDIQALGMLSNITAIVQKQNVNTIENDINVEKDFCGTLREQQINCVKEDIYNKFHIDVGAANGYFECYIPSGTENLEVKEIYHLEEVSIVENWCEFFNELEKLCEY